MTVELEHRNKKKNNRKDTKKKKPPGQLIPLKTSFFNLKQTFNFCRWQGNIKCCHWICVTVYTALLLKLHGSLQYWHPVLKGSIASNTYSHCSAFWNGWQIRKQLILIGLKSSLFCCYICVHICVHIVKVLCWYRIHTCFYKNVYESGIFI